MGKYDDIIGLDRPVSRNHIPMPLEKRAAQFMPFAALTGYDDAVEETGRLTTDKVELTEERISEIDERLSEIEESLHSHEVSVTVTYFVPDLLKSGGEYVTEHAQIKRIDTYKSCLVLADRRTIPIKDIYRIDTAT
ncbi:MAG: YolD-like family protein [Butyrivibrio sp.]|nr:YolD-like family protein [Butyrivibrio sp.]